MKIVGLKINSCRECPFHDEVRKKNEAFYHDFCTLVMKDIENREIPKWCPLVDYEKVAEIIKYFREEG